MDLTQLTHTLTISGTTHTIDEPVNFDTMKLTMKRNADYHGISIETTEATLQFYDSNNHTAASLIRTAFEANIDTDITYTVTDTSNNSVVYQGKLDLSTYNERSGPYFAVELKVGEMGIKTTFNNRTETEINLNSTKTIEGNNLTHTPTWKRLQVPAKTMIYTNRVTTDYQTILINEANCDSGRYHLPSTSSHHFIAFKMGDKANINEFETFSNGFSDIADQIGTGDISGENIGDYYEPIYEQNLESEDYEKKYGAGAKYNLDINITVGLSFSGGDLFETERHMQDTFGPYTVYITGKYIARLVLLGEGSTFGTPVIVAQSSQATITNAQSLITTPLTINTQITNQNKSKLYLGILLENQTTYHTSRSATEIRANWNYQRNVVLQVMYNNSLTMKLRSTITQTAFATMLPIHEALNKVTEIISDNQLTVKSDYYGRPDSQVNPAASFGGGSLKAITNGYRLRAIDEATRQMPVTFKDIIESLDAIDCIGWGFTTENGATCLRIERWEYFYNDQVVLTITNPNEKKRSVDTNRAVTEISIGYKKYVDAESINSVESLHSEHTYSNRCKSITKAISKKCSFIADVYAIEETRRKQFENDTSEFKYDENVFVFELAANDTATAGTYTYAIPVNYISAPSGLTDPEEYFNMRITPHRNAARWIKYLKWTNYTKVFDFISGKMNVNVRFRNDPPAGTNYSHLHGYQSISYYENGELSGFSTVNALTKKEIVQITYPLTITEYQALKANPYGIIKVDNTDYWLQEASYEFKTGETTLKLIPKA